MRRWQAGVGLGAPESGGAADPGHPYSRRGLTPPPEPLSAHELAQKLRPEREVQEMVERWLPLVELRAHQYFESEGLKTKDVLAMIAKDTPRGKDPVDHDGQACIEWQGWADYGDCPSDWKDPKTGETGPNAAVVKGLGKLPPVFVSRLLGYAFARSEVFKKMQRSKVPSFSTTCGNRMCVNVNHILIADKQPDVDAQPDVPHSHRE